MILAKNRPMNPWDGVESAETDPHEYSQPTSDKGAKATQWSSDFNKRDWSNWTSTCGEMNPDAELVLFPKINSNWTISLNLKHKTVILLEDNKPK